MKKTFAIIILWLASLALAELFIHSRFCKSNGGQMQSDTIIVMKPYAKPIAHDSFLVRTVTRTLPIYRTVHDTATITDRDTIIDSVAVNVPISKKIYKEDDYYAEVSGFEPNLDSIAIKTKTITNTITITKETSRFGLGISGGYAITPKGLQPYIGIGIQYNIFTWPKRKTN